LLASFGFFKIREVKEPENKEVEAEAAPCPVLISHLLCEFSTFRRFFLRSRFAIESGFLATEMKAGELNQLVWSF